PAGTRGAVNAFDLNVLPQSVISSVEILKDGASSIYGSDAVAGVVNIITKRNQDGFTLDGFGSMPLKDGGEEFRAAATWGKEFSRGHIQASVDYFRRNELARGQRDYLNCGEDNYFTTTGGRADAVDPRNGQFKCTNLLWGHVWTYNYPVQAMFNPVTGATPQPPSTAADTVIPKTELFTFSTAGAYQLGENVEVYAEVLGNRRESYVNSSRQFWQFGFPEDWCGFGFGDPLAGGWSGCILISPTPYTDHSDSSQRVDYLRALGGMRGDMPGDLLPGWKWDVYAQHSRNKGKYRAQRILQDAIDSQDDRGFSGVPCAGTTLPVSGRPCLDINWTDPEFLRGNLTDAQRAFLFDFEEGLTVYTQTYVEAIFDGDVIDLPAGTVKAAIGATWRRDEINDTPGPIPRAGNAWGSSSAGIPAGSSRTTEVFGEVDLPLIKDAPMIQSFTVQGAARFTDVSTFGSDVTYKVGANWQVNDWLRFRGTYGTSFRAPALFELFLADQTSFAQQRLIDPCITWGRNLANG
ncbi:MAG TPA: TonB-dependent receptor, partial [Lacipirellulaceae bacterium]|nr:TonB-dependent receptor [Lacipirellulaceae bacterium]